MTKNKNLETIVFGGGCFWCTEAIFHLIKGVESVESGYAGGHVENPSYNHIHSGSSGHAEVIKVEFDPEKISLENLLRIFFQAHDPTVEDKQGSDIGPEYRSIILWTDGNQLSVIKPMLVEIRRELDKKIVTEVQALTKFYPAEKEHQNYFKENPNKPYCVLNISPKIRKLKKYLQDNDWLKTV
ncbi:peptide-methionine (S)-S-oxide reductase [Candidatus Falkowbacteria bacterium CG10_big_fil_rev_8_21_14_0_10_39_11]|uniref:Peptide methionine sulfoxide reductase MsrA n=1 Tax=Candidatus Falkowbacteria bacterium CG10_big_fil_rev_8_21_14_0_10_39_11 TaxID=1974565 RepID=A0A2H0V534_9BACT|nr:MAG: peptide-methionine (S)-S-oxide reductase [Candidatus Falkowbacteria bacterium CG10_big_fil_rev_8_21_14_0_10_39_11]